MSQVSTTPAGASGKRHDRQAVSPGTSRTFTYYAHPDIGETAALLRDWGDVVTNPSLGLYGAVVVGPRGSTYSDPATGEDIGLKSPFRNLFLFNEFNYDQLITGPSGQTFPTILATPGIAYVSYHFELALGTQLALNNASRPGTHAAVVGLLDIFYDSILPKIGNWTINRGFPG